ncbi:ExbD/TolR family protein [Pontivivens ytuae]|nr:biopolymer transporter ExbD [Pontivivens ytuae]
MINVVFLLLIFFLMTAQIAPSDPFEVELPASEGQQPAEGRDVLYVSAQGELAFDGARGEAVFNAVASEELRGPLLIRADARVSAVEIATLLPRLSAIGISETVLVTTQ